MNNFTLQPIHLVAACACLILGVVCLLLALFITQLGNRALRSPRLTDFQVCLDRHDELLKQREFWKQADNQLINRKARTHYKLEKAEARVAAIERCRRVKR